MRRRPAPRSTASSTPHSHMLKTIGRPVARSASRIVVYASRVSWPVGVAPVVLQVVDAPRGVALRVLRLVVRRARPPGAGLRARVGVDAELEALRVDVVGERLHARREPLRVGHDRAVGVAAHLPAVVDHDVLVAGVLHAARDQRVGRLRGSACSLTLQPNLFQLFQPIGGAQGEAVRRSGGTGGGEEDGEEDGGVDGRAHSSLRSRCPAVYARKALPAMETTAQAGRASSFESQPRTSSSTCPRSRSLCGSWRRPSYSRSVARPPSLRHSSRLPST